LQTDFLKILERLSTEIARDLAAEANKPVALVGIRSGGVPIAEALARLLVPLPVQLGAVDITLYRDDLYTGLEKPVLGQTDLPFDINGCRILLVDDVLFTGRTVRAALDEILDYGRPAWVRLVVVVDRGHRELPIAADYVGVKMETRREDTVKVSVEEGVIVFHR
jgi:pyrimidine operon attenuation protein/uracil phosphoribosyltransferase